MRVRSSSLPAVTTPEKIGASSIAGSEEFTSMRSIKFSELADVAGPRASLERLLPFRRNLPEARDVSAVVTLDEMASEQRDVLAALAERRHADAEHVEPEEEVSAEPILRHHPLHVPIRGGDHAGVEAQEAARADGLELAALEHAQQLHLRARGEILDLVEEQRPAVGGLEEAAAVADGAGEGAANVPKSSLSKRLSGTSAQLTATNGPRARGPASWMARATSSLPVPVSPSISTVAVDAAARRIVARKDRMALLSRRWRRFDHGRGPGRRTSDRLRR